MKSSVTNSKENENSQVISQVQSLLLNVEEALSSACTKMLCVNSQWNSQGPHGYGDHQGHRQVPPKWIRHHHPRHLIFHQIPTD